MERALKMKILTFAASLRKGSFNRKLIAQATALLRTLPGTAVDAADYREFEMPLYDGDLEEASADLPKGAQALIARIRAADAVVISTPEYNGGIPGTLKNAIDWVSRDDNNPLEGKPVLLIGASPGALGAVRSLWHTRHPFEVMGSFVYPEMFGLARAHQAFDDAGGFVDPKNGARVLELLTDYLSFARKLTVA
jgi:NAD(P)H-dependent FMN reductase